MHGTSSPAPVVIVGAGLAGLRCAGLLHEQSVAVVVLEASDQVGGRLRTHVTDGFRLDRGFQALLTAAPALQRAVDPRRLELCPLDVWTAGPADHGPLAVIQWQGAAGAIVGALASPLLPWGDRLRLARLAAALRLAEWDGVREVRGVPRAIADELGAQGFSRWFLERFARPLLRATTLDADLAASADVGNFTLKLLVQGRLALPARGLQALPDLLAARLPPGCVRLQTGVAALARERETGAVTGVLTREGPVAAAAVVVATDGRSASVLSGLDVPQPSLGCTTVYLAGREWPHRRGRLTLAAGSTPGPLSVSHAALLTGAAPAYAPDGWHLLAATVLGSPPETDDAVADTCRAELQGWFPHAEPRRWKVLDVVRVPDAMLRQPPGLHASLPGPRVGVKGLFLAGEYTEDSSVNGALRSGERAAWAVLADLGRAPVPGHPPEAAPPRPVGRDGSRYAGRAAKLWR